MPALANYYQQAKPYDIQQPNVTGALGLYYSARDKQREFGLKQQAGAREERRLRLGERADERVETQFKETQTPEAIRLKQREIVAKLTTAEATVAKNIAVIGQDLLNRTSLNGDEPGTISYAKALEELEKSGADISKLPTPESFGGDAAKFDKAAEEMFYHAESLGKELDNKLKLEKLKTAKAGKAGKDTWGAAKEGVDAKGNPIVYTTDKKGNVKILKGVFPTPKKGERITVSEDGVVTIERGVGLDVTKKTMGTIEEKLLAGQEGYARLLDMESKFREEFQETGPRFGAAWTDIMSKLGKDVSPKDKQFLIDFKKHQRTGIENINKYIRDMTGAQMSEKEADRLRLAQPDPGEKWYQGDSPITYKAKLDDVLLGARAAITRYNYYKSKDISNNTIVEMINKDEAMDLEKLMDKMRE